jgi:hypothetical protein
MISNKDNPMMRLYTQAFKVAGFKEWMRVNPENDMNSV